MPGDKIGDRRGHGDDSLGRLQLSKDLIKLLRCNKRGRNGGCPLRDCLLEDDVDSTSDLDEEDAFRNIWHIDADVEPRTLVVKRAFYVRVAATKSV